MYCPDPTHKLVTSFEAHFWPKVVSTYTVIKPSDKEHKSSLKWKASKERSSLVTRLGPKNLHKFESCTAQRKEKHQTKRTLFGCVSEKDGAWVGGKECLSN